MAEILDAVRSLPPTVPTPTLMEVSGYAHIEAVSSNTLAFFLDTAGPHHLGPVVLQALFEALGTAAPLSDATVEREVRTDAGNRIDLLVETDTHLVGIENKVFHDVDNPLEDYRAFLSERAKKGAKELLLILLALQPGVDEPGHGFRALSYRCFAERLHARLAATNLPDNKYRVLLDDFLDTMANLQGGSRMDKSWLALFADRRSELEGLLEHTNAFKDDLRQRVKGLGKTIDVAELPNVKQWFWTEPHRLHDVLVHDITCADGLEVALDAVVGPTGWSFEFFLRAPGGKKRLRNRLDALAIEYSDVPSAGDPSGKDVRAVHTVHFDLEEDLVKVGTSLKALIEKIAK